MWPQVYGIPTYILIYTLGVIAHGVILQTRARRFGQPWSSAMILGTLYFVAMFPGARILSDIIDHRFSIENLMTLHYWTCKDCWSLWGGPLVYLAMALAWVVLAKKNDADSRDYSIAALPYAMIIAKLACFANGCCHGVPCTMPWSVTFPDGADAPVGVALHPTQLYEIAVLLLICYVFGTLNRERWRGTWLAWFLAIYGAGRLITEFWRSTEELRGIVGSLSTSQWLCGTASLIAMIWLLAQARRSALQAERNLDAPDDFDSSEA